MDNEESILAELRKLITEEWCIVYTYYISSEWNCLKINEDITILSICYEQTSQLMEICNLLYIIRDIIRI